MDPKGIFLPKEVSKPLPPQTRSMATGSKRRGDSGIIGWTAFFVDFPVSDGSIRMFFDYQSSVVNRRLDFLSSLKSPHDCQDCVKSLMMGNNGFIKTTFWE
jgi:hypothetical protein